MKTFLKKGLIVTLCLGLAAGLFACGSSGEKTKDGDKTLFTYDGTKVTLKEAWIYAKMLAANYEQNYSTYFGTTDFWTMSIGTDDDGNATTMEDSVKQQVIEQIKQIIVLDNKAEELGCSLTDEDKEECEKYAEAFADDDTGKAILKECGADESDIEKIYEDNALASKVQEKMVEDADTDISDEEARTSKITRIVFETTTTDDEGNTTDMSADEKEAVLKKAQDALKAIDGGTSIEDEAEALEFTDTTETFAKGESEEGTAFEERIASVDDGTLIDEVLECDNGYVIARLDAYTDADATAQTKESMISERQQEAFNDTYAEWTEELEKDWDYEEDVDQDLWAQVVLHSEDSTGTEAGEETTGAEATTAAEDAAAAETATAAEAATAAESTTAAK